MVEVKLYVEGGGDSRILLDQCREGFTKLLQKCDLPRLPRVVACGGREKAWDKFQTAVRLATKEELPMLLVDSEELVSLPPIKHLSQRWPFPASVSESQVHLMVTTMETWIIADRQALQSAFGSELNEKVLPPLKDLELREKEAVLKSLESATKNCPKDRAYQKGRRSFKLVGALDPKALHQLPHFIRFIDALRSALA